MKGEKQRGGEEFRSREVWGGKKARFGTMKEGKRAPLVREGNEAWTE